MFVATKGWVSNNLEKIVHQWGYYPSLKIADIMPYLGEYTYNLKAAQKIIEKHLWGSEIEANVNVKFLPMETPGRIELVQIWSSGRITLNMTIEVSDKYRDDVKAQMTILAHEYAHAYHYLRGDFDRPDNNLEYENLTDLSTIALGMGELSLIGKEINKDAYSKINLGYLSKDLMLFAQELYRGSEGKYTPCTEKPHTTIGPETKKPWSHEEPAFTPYLIPGKIKIPQMANVWKAETFHVLIDSNNTVIPIQPKSILGRDFVKKYISPKNKSTVSKKQLEIEFTKGGVILTNIGKNSLDCEYEKVYRFLGFVIKKQVVKKSLSQKESVNVKRPPVRITFPGENIFYLK